MRNPIFSFVLRKIYVHMTKKTVSLGILICSLDQNLPSYIFNLENASLIHVIENTFVMY